MNITIEKITGDKDTDALLDDESTNQYKEIAIMCDLDGTLALKHKNRTWYDASTCDVDIVNTPVYEVLIQCIEQYHIIFCSGREDKYREQTLKFLNKAFDDVSFVENHDFSLFMRATDDFRKDSIVKHEIYYRDIYNNYNVSFVLDDRSQVVNMWRDACGLTCFQVAEGNF
jgi:hypothetical protein